ncbi:IS6 family transposase, partial [Salmonella enterica]|nr:IS6 family transposase [Salmonella enterica]
MVINLSSPFADGAAHVRWYCKYGISYRELQEMLAERGVNVDHSTIYRWV